MPAKSRTKRYKPNQVVPPIGFVDIPKNHLVINVSITQEGGAIDKDKALEILRTRPYAAKVLPLLKYRGATSKFHVFSYQNPK